MSQAREGLRELTGDFKSHGIDVSRYQGKIDWNLFFKKNNGTIKFVYCKATEGMRHVDKNWERNKTALQNKEIGFGAYHFFIPSANASQQAEHFLNHYVPAKHDLPPVLDVETESVPDDKLIQRMKEWLKIVEQKTGRRPVIYTSYHFYDTKFRNRFAGHQFWIANYSKKESRVKDECIIHWQYSDKGRIPGIRGPVDLNMSKIDYR